MEKTEEKYVVQGGYRIDGDLIKTITITHDHQTNIMTMNGKRFSVELLLDLFTLTEEVPKKIMKLSMNDEGLTLTERITGRIVCEECGSLLDLEFAHHCDCCVYQLVPSSVPPCEKCPHKHGHACRASDCGFIKGEPGLSEGEYFER